MSVTVVDSVMFFWMTVVLSILALEILNTGFAHILSIIT